MTPLVAALSVLLVVLLAALVVVRVRLRREAAAERDVEADVEADVEVDVDAEAVAVEAGDTGEQEPEQLDDRPRPRDAWDTDPASRDVRTLQLQVATLTEALRAMERERDDAAARTELEPRPEGAPDASADVDLEVEIDVDTPRWLAAAPEPLTPLVPEVPDGEAPYARLSRRLARAGRLPEAAVAQWAADLRRLRPLLAGRDDALATALAGLPPADPDVTIAAARAVALRLVDADEVPMLDDTSHLSAAWVPAGGTASPSAAGEAPSGLPDHLDAALAEVLSAAAHAGGDGSGRTVALRRELLADLRRHPSDVVDVDETAVVRRVLEPHEHAHLDDVLARSAS